MQNKLIRVMLVDRIMSAANCADILIPRELAVKALETYNLGTGNGTTHVLMNHAIKVAEPEHLNAFAVTENITHRITDLHIVGDEVLGTLHIIDPSKIDAETQFCPVIYFEDFDVNNYNTPTGRRNVVDVLAFHIVAFECAPILRLESDPDEMFNTAHHVHKDDLILMDCPV